MGQKASKSKWVPADNWVPINNRLPIDNWVPIDAADEDPLLEFIARVRHADRNICWACANLICAIAGNDHSRPKKTESKSSESSIIHHSSIHELLICGHVCSGCDGIMKFIPPEVVSSIDANNKVLLREVFGSDRRLLGFQIVNRRIIALRVYAESDSLLSKRIMGRPVQRNGGSRKVLDLARNWIEDCAKNHPECRWAFPGREQEPLLPKRVIDVSIEPIRIVVTESKSGKWVALSHRWGQVEFLKTTKANYENFQVGVAQFDLPASFRDAVAITRYFGVRYLWIDSLCIIQDSTEDWQVQSAMMPEIYKNAYVTIAAAATENSNGGILVNRIWAPTSLPCQLPVPYMGGIGTVHLDLEFFDDYRRKNQRYTNTSINYLLDRAWCFQESHLSRRLLTFDQLQVSFTCLYHGLVECQESAPAPAREERNGFLSSVHESLAIADSKASMRSLIAVWYNLLQDYTARSLTFSKDKLVAISGIAKVIGTALGDTYYAGLWAKNMPQALLWSPYEEEALPNAPHEAGYPQEYRAPTWSWASIDGPISCFICKETYSKTTVATVLQIRTTLNGPDAYGQVKFGYIKVRGPLKHAVSIKALNVWPKQPGLIWDDQDELDYSHGIFDVSKTIGTDVWCLHVTDIYGLILQRIEDPSVAYLRLGVSHRRSHAKNPVWWKDSDITTINIV